MNADIFAGKWKQMKGSVQSYWGKLTDDDIDRIAGDSERLVGVVQERYGKDKEEARKEVNDYIDSL
ncbi:MAG: CsbD family protein [Gammaproteobacteria bacterium]